jgi:hypothetical protein
MHTKLLPVGVIENCPAARMAGNDQIIALEYTYAYLETKIC